MNQERRRYFRITDSVGVSYQFMDADSVKVGKDHSVDVLDLMSEQDAQIEKLLLEVAGESPKVAALVRALNQKLERVVSQLVVDSRLVGRLANRIREVNISACGMAFVHDLDVKTGARLSLELELKPDDYVIATEGIVVGVEPYGDAFYWRIDFYGMSTPQQERLIQHIVKRQSVLLSGSREK